MAACNHLMQISLLLIGYIIGISDKEKVWRKSVKFEN